MTVTVGGDYWGGGEGGGGGSHTVHPLLKSGESGARQKRDCSELNDQHHKLIEPLVFASNFSHVSVELFSVSSPQQPCCKC